MDFGFRIMWLLKKVLLGLYWDTGRENGNYYFGFGV